MRLRFFQLALGLFVCVPLLVWAQGDPAPQADSLKLSQSAQSADSLLESADSSRKLEAAKELLLKQQLEEAKASGSQEISRLKTELDSLRKTKTTQDSALRARMDSLRLVTPGMAVAPFDSALFKLYRGIGSFALKERVAAIEERIQRIADDRTVDLEKIQVAKNEGLISIVFDDRTIMSITEKDALWAGVDEQTLANAHRDKMVAGIDAYLKATGFWTILKEIALGILVVGIVVAIVVYLNKGYRWLKSWLEKKQGDRLKPWKFRDYEVLSASQIRRGIELLLSLVRYLIMLLVIMFALPLVFSFFPVTEDYSMQILGYILSPLKNIGMGIINFLPNLITIVIIVVVTRYFIKLVRYFAKEIKNEKLELPGFYADWAMPTFSILRFMMYAFMIVAIFPYLPGSDSAVFQGVTVFLGILVSLGSSNAISNLVAGLVITYMRPFRIGDRIQTGEVTGDVIEKTLLVTRLRTVKNEEITLPNAQVLNTHTKNYTTIAAKEGLILNTTVTIGYDVPWAQVQECLIEAALNTEHIDQEKPPFVLQTGLEDFYVSYQLNAYTKKAYKMAVIYSDLHANIQNALHAAGIEILSPHYHALRDGNVLTVPPNNIPEDYDTPSFRVKQTDSD